MIRLPARFALYVALGSSPLAVAGEPAPSPLQGAAAAPSKPEESALSPEQLLGALSRSLQSRFGLVGDLELDFANAWTPPKRTASVWNIVMLEYPSSASASMVVRFRIVADSTPLEDDTVVLRASLWANALFAREPLSSGAALDTDFVEARRVDAFRVRDAIPAGTPDTDLVLSRAVQAGSMLTWHDVGHRPLVKKGDIVEVSATSGLLRITLKALALQNGALGDVVTVRNPESLKVIPAQVVGENRVEVRL
jgi:flagella basal body P-ring formation protein FlgA